jgi:hypothetical protein
MTTSEQVIEELVNLVHGTSDLRTQCQYRTNLQILVELAKCEQRHETAMDLPEFGNRINANLIH